MLRPLAMVSRQRFNVKICSMKVSRSLESFRRPFLLHRQQGEVPGEGPGEHADPFLFRHALGVVDLDPFQAAAGGIAFEDESAQVFLFELADALLGPAGHALGMIHLGARGHESRVFRIAHQPESFAGYGKTGLHLGAHRHELQVFPERAREVAVVFVAAVEAHRLAEKACADSNPDPVFHEKAPCE